LGYSDSDFVGSRVDRKSTSGDCHLLGRSIVSWSSKKQNSVALSTAEAKYIAAGACCAQILYMKQTLLDFGVKLHRIPLLCDNESAIKIAKNLVQHSRTKHIDIRHHFLRDHEAKGDISLQGVRSEEQLADIFTKPLDESTFRSEEQSIRLVMHPTGCISTDSSRKRHMNSSLGRNQTSPTFESLVANASFIRRKCSVSLRVDVMKDSFLVMHQTPKHIEYSIKPPG